MNSPAHFPAALHANPMASCASARRTCQCLACHSSNSGGQGAGFSDPVPADLRIQQDLWDAEGARGRIAQLRALHRIHAPADRGMGWALALIALAMLGWAVIL